MRVTEEPVCIDLIRQNPVFTSLHLKSPVHVHRLRKDLPPTSLFSIFRVTDFTGNQKAIEVKETIFLRGGGKTIMNNCRKGNINVFSWYSAFSFSQQFYARRIGFAKASEHEHVLKNAVTSMPVYWENLRKVLTGGSDR
jgi:hypothetical protein